MPWAVEVAVSDTELSLSGIDVLWSFLDEYLEPVLFGLIVQSGLALFFV